jgi:pimeloyl-ACP methyl ester carboxylesterase
MTRAASELRFGTARVATGLRLHYVERGDPAGHAVLFLHGWPDSWFSFSRVLPLLPQHYHSFAVDQRGFGESERPEDGYGIDDLAGDAVAFLDAIGVERATMVGHSLGTFVARRVAELNRERVARLVLIDSGFSPVNPVMRDVQASIRELTDPVPTAFAREFQASTAHVPLPPEFFERIVTESLKAPARVWRDVFEGLLAFDDAKQLPGIAVPTLLLWGERDAIFSRDDQHRLVAAIPNARLEIYPETGHCPNWERPEKVAADLAAFAAET